MGLEEKIKSILDSSHKVCKTKFQGGLDLRKNKDLNKALMMKVGWRLAQDLALGIKL